MNVTFIPLNKLRLAKTNVRRTNGNIGIEMLAANIKAHGLINPLQVVPAKKKDHYDVFAGGRRLRALTLLSQDGSIDEDHAVPVEIKEASDSLMRDISLSENAMRVAMTAADECLAYDQMLGKDKTADNIARVAASYGTTVRHIEARLRLANLADPIFAGLSDGSITLDAAKTYGLTSDKARQLAAYESLTSVRGQNDEWRIRKLLFDDSITAGSAIALFVGEQAYRDAGGKIEVDLFKDAGSANWTDAHIARTLAEQKLAEIAEQERVAHQLGWVTPIVKDHVSYDDYQQLHHYYPQRVKLSDEEQAEHDKIEERISEISEMFEYGEFEPDNEAALQEELETLETQYRQFEARSTFIPDDDREHVGTFLVLTKDGGTELYGQLFTTQTPKCRNGSSGAGGTDPVTDTPPVHSRSLTEDLAMQRRDILALHLAQDPALALDLAIFKLAAGELHADYSLGITLGISSVNDPQGSTSTKSSPAIEALAQIRDTLDVSWFDARDDIGNFERFRALDDDIKASWLSYCMATSLKASLATKGNYHNPFHTMLGSMLDIDMAANWRPTAAGYFSKLRKPAILETIGALGDPSLVSRYASSKKTDLAEAAEKIFAGDALIDADIKQAALAWVPEELRITGDDPVAQEDDEQQVADDAEIVGSVEAFVGDDANAHADELEALAA